MTTPASLQSRPPDEPPRGLFLPSLTWTTDRRKVLAEKRRLEAVSMQLEALVDKAHPSDFSATWHLMAEASLCQLYRDIETLLDWLEQ